MSETRGPIVMTLMVRDEADIVAAMIEHHLDQGVDLIIATDNASQDGTREILAKYEALGVLELHDDPRHNKQQAEVVTKMARRAVDEHGASWVINADADEFWVPADRTKTLAEVLPKLPESVRSLRVPVFNLFGAPVESGPSLSTLQWRDTRDEKSLNAVGLHAQPTPNMLVRGEENLQIAQGNHFSNLPVTEPDQIDEALCIETLHVPYRSWEQYRRRVLNTGAAYEASGLRPSPRHHGMRDYRWSRTGVLKPFFVARYPEVTDGQTSAPEGFVRDEWLTNHLRDLAKDERVQGAIEPLLTDATPMKDANTQRDRFTELSTPLLEMERERVEVYTGLQYAHDIAVEQRNEEHTRYVAENERRMQLEEQVLGLRMHTEGLEAQREELGGEIDDLNAQIDALHKQIESLNISIVQLQEYTASVVSNRAVRVALAANSGVQKAKQGIRRR